MPMQIYTLPTVTVISGSQSYALCSTPTFTTSITIQADYNNVGRISIGGSTVTPATGISISAGESAVIEHPPARGAEEFDVAKVYVTSSNAGDVARVSYMKNG